MKTNAFYSLLRGARLLLSALTVVLGTAVFLSSAKFLQDLPMCQLGPAVLRAFFSFGLSALAVVLTIALLTLLFGRLFCSFMCPLGSALSFIALFSKKGKKNIYPFIGGLILGAFLGFLAFGLAFVFRLLDPYSLFGRALTSPLWFGIVFLAVILIVTFLFGRLFCTSICPVGLLLSLIARRSAFGLAIPDECVHCGKCERACPTGCIDQKQSKVNNAYCVMCLDCLTVCPKTGPTFSFLWKKPEKEKAPDMERRQFLISLSVGAAAGLVGGGLSKIFLKKSLKAPEEKEFPVRPPGAITEASFLAKCTACGLCVSKCPQKVISLGPAGFGSPRLDFKKGACSLDCALCSSICPTGALRKIDPERKKSFVRGKANFNAKKCIVFQSEGACGRCAKVCPTSAIILRVNGTPKLEPEACLGCGKCQHVCPTGAMHVAGVKIQYYLEDLNQGASL